ncbi:iron uptake transporter deferrochelatase/peroxidase subunit [Neobacillus sp. SM06]|uniref:iron uptake transporter deferrochelatase/peroxidase subunit n=1 Tax=Neobacillus sp. SM06 TaxID=3422492 RepID=UPI003D291B92
MSSKSSSNKFSRRDILKMTAMAGAGIALGASGFGAVTAMSDVFDKQANASPKEQGDVISFFGKHQAGIATPQQAYAYIAAFKLLTEDKQEVIKLFKQWTDLGAKLSEGKINTETSINDFVPPADSGEADDFSSSKLTITFGLGSTFFIKNGIDRYGLAQQKPKQLKDIPPMPKDALQEPFIGGDLCIQVCADVQQVAFHAIRNLIKTASGLAEVQWIQAGFLNKKDGQTPRNLFGFKDGTANPSPDDQAAFQSIVWASEDEPDWMNGGSYMACRKIQMMLEVWDRSSFKNQEDTFGRKKSSGAAYGKLNEHDAVDVTQLPFNSHVRIAKETGQQIFRRAYSYTDGMDPTTGNLNAGLMFISYQKNPETQFIPMLRKLSQFDMLNEYTKHIGSALFAVPGGIRKGEYLAQRLLEK